MITHVDVSGYEQVLRIERPELGLLAFIAVHSTAFGPAAGGLRMRPYDDEADALDDVLRLARGMTYKNVAANLPLGGGKAVIIGDPHCEKTPEKLLAVAQVIESLGGAYWTAEDMGMGPDDMELIASRTAYVAGRSNGAYASGDPSPVTAAGVFAAIKATYRRRFRHDIAGAAIAIQGLGHVGWSLAEKLAGAGCRLIVADTDRTRVDRARAAFGCAAAEPDEIIYVEADLFAPCAIGGVLNDETIPRLSARAIAGAANNQLAEPRHGRMLDARGVLYAPDYVANGGGIINVAAEINRIDNREDWVAGKLANLSATLDAIFDEAEREGLAPPDAADQMVERRLHDAALKIAS